MSVQSRGGSKRRSPAPPARPRRQRTYLAAGDRRAQILARAKQIFAARGYHAASIEHICDAAEIARGTLYQYFDNKRDVLMAVIQEVAARVEAIVARRPRVDRLPLAPTAKRDDIVSFCKKRLRQVLDAIFVDEETLRILLREARGADGAIDEVIARIDASMLAAIEADVRAAQRAGILRPMQPRLVALYVLGGIEKIVLTALTGDEPFDLDQVVEDAVELELFGLLTEEVRR